MKLPEIFGECCDFGIPNCFETWLTERQRMIGGVVHHLQKQKQVVFRFHETILSFGELIGSLGKVVFVGWKNPHVWYFGLSHLNRSTRRFLQNEPWDLESLEPPQLKVWTLCCEKNMYLVLLMAKMYKSHLCCCCCCCCCWFRRCCCCCGGGGGGAGGGGAGGVVYSQMAAMAANAAI